MKPADLQRFLDQHDIAAEIVRLKDPTPTVQTAADAVGAHPDQIIKSLLFLVGGRPVLAIACGTQPVDQRTLAAHYGVGRRQVKLADPAAVAQLTGFEAGGVPPFGHPAPVETLLDPRVLEQPFIYGGGGDDHSLLRIAPEELRRATGAAVVPLSNA